MCLPQFCPLDFLDPKMDSSPLCLSRFREQIPGSQCRRVEIPFYGLKLRCKNSAWKQGSGTQYLSRIFWKSLLISISFLRDNLFILCVCGKIEKGRQSGDSWPTKSCKTGWKTTLLQLLCGVPHLILECGIYCLVTSVKTGTKTVPTEKPSTQTFFVLNWNSGVHLS